MAFHLENNSVNNFSVGNNTLKRRADCMRQDVYNVKVSLLGDLWKLVNTSLYLGSILYFPIIPNLPCLSAPTTNQLTYVKTTLNAFKQSLA